MTTANPVVAHAGLDFLGKAAFVLLTFQAGGLAAPPARDVTITALVAAMWAALALKGAAAGRFKPGGYLGLRVTWRDDPEAA